jgi:dipeptidyl aminopeptidase/acylaminoacyl peptidase
MLIPTAARSRIQEAKLIMGLVTALAVAGLYAPRVLIAEPPAATNNQVSVPDRGRAYKARLTPHWFDHNHRFWYRNDLPSGKEFILVDAERGERRPAFDHQRLAAALTKAAGSTYQAENLPFDAIQFGEDGQSIWLRVDGTSWKCDLTSYACAKTVAPPEAAPSAPTASDRRRPPRTSSERSPDGKWTAFIREGNVYLRAADGKERQLSQDGRDGLAYGMLSWSPDSQALVAFRIEPGDHKEVYLIESSPPGGGRAKLRTRPYALPGDKFTAYELNLFTLADGKQIKPEVERIDYDYPQLHWKKDGRHFLYQKVDRGHQRFRVIAVDAHTGQARTIIDEKSKTFIWTAHAENLRLALVNYLDESDEILYVSERDGWRHLYLIDGKTGASTQLTHGDYVVRGINRIDAANRQVWFQASGKNPGQDPYFLHYYRVNFDGSHLVALTEGDGAHTMQFSPDMRFGIDTYSRVDQAPVHELRRTSDGKLLCVLERADDSELRAKGWQPPEVFVAKGRDGTTDIWGIICRPRQFDPQKKYPVIEQIYAGPQGSFVPKAFSPGRIFSSLTDLGFIVVQIDGMGTANRSKAFHDVCWKNLKDAGFADRILWHQAAARKYPYYDLERVGIVGVSAGGQNAAAGVLFHPEFYKVAVAACGCHANRMDKASWNEQWMGYPVGPQYAASSNIDNAYRLRGKLLLIVGELDTNVPPESTLRLANALIKVGKDFDLVVVPGAGHGMGGAYGARRMRDFFVRHLLGSDPPDRNAVSTAQQRSARPADGEAAGRPSNNGMPTVTAPPAAVLEKSRPRDREAARSFYTKYLDVKGIPLLASSAVANEALERGYQIVTSLLAGRPDIVEGMARHGTRLIIIGKDQVYTDMPEYRQSRNPTYLNERVRGTGGFDVTSFGEENLLNLPLDRYDDESIAVHEFCHTIDAALSRIDSTWRRRLVETYRHAINQGLWKNAYTASNPAEYWAEICQSYFDCNRINNWNHAAVGTREQLKLYDPAGYELVKETFRLPADKDWRYRPLRQQPSVILPPAKFKIDPYYTKFTYAREFIVLGSSRARDEALLKANDTIRKLFAYRHDILKAMIADGARLVVLGQGEKLSDLPELKETKERAECDPVRYLDYTPERKLLVVPEENVLGLPRDPFAGQSMVIHVFAKGLYHVTAQRPVIPDFQQRRDRQQYELRVKRMDIEFDHRLNKLYDEAMSKLLWKGTPAAHDRVEYWAAGVEAYFDAAGQGASPHLADRPITTRETLKSYDPALFALVDETMGYQEHADWRYRR